MKYDFKRKIEDMSDEEVKQRITDAYKHPLPPLHPIPYIGDPEVIHYNYPELTALCPMTGLQDLYTIDIKFVPTDTIPELKSIKMYLMAFRDLPISHEHIASRVHRDFHTAIHPEQLQVHLDVAVRGGIKTKVLRGDKNVHIKN